MCLKFFHVFYHRYQIIVIRRIGDDVVLIIKISESVVMPVRVEIEWRMLN